MIRAAKTMYRASKALLVWVNLLFTVNLSVLAMLFIFPTELTWVAFLLGFGVGILPNIVFVLKNHGVGYFMSVTHVLGWTPLQVYLLVRVFSDNRGPALNAEHDGLLFWWVVLLLVMNGISLVFDYRDALRWLRGNRSILFEGAFES